MRVTKIARFGRLLSKILRNSTCGAFFSDIMNVTLYCWFTPDRTLLTPAHVLIGRWLGVLLHLPQYWLEEWATTKTLGTNYINCAAGVCSAASILLTSLLSVHRVCILVDTHFDTCIDTQSTVWSEDIRWRKLSNGWRKIMQITARTVFLL